MTIKLIKNEFIKMIYEKKFYVLLVTIITMLIATLYIYMAMKNYAIADSIEAQKYSVEWKEQLKNMNSIIFLDNYSTSFIFKSGIPFFLIFVTIFAVDCFGEDFYSGNLKFFANLDTRGESLFKAKVVYLIIFSLIIVIINLVLGFISSSIVFHIKFQGIFRSLIIYLSSILPVVSFSLIVGLISMFIRNRAIRTVVGVGLCISVGILDKIVKVDYFSPIGIISIIASKQVENIKFIDLAICNSISLIYFILAFFIGKIIFKKIEYKY
ncbi:hypothetical protein [Clostridium cibarium]|uniref:ABC-2 family transporter protein n=1 Tax=Clostridium cibarium TaxID=2762247 RepID=A0ABR8PR99_9CLOT|nr:hypothetical protein [Clostridium cibarium]MBD7910677.1 hypothetical protein [Clostridium cibarium]